jgi:hypothetical protein
VWAWGANNERQLGTTDVAGNYSTPARVPGLSGVANIGCDARA